MYLVILVFYNQTVRIIANRYASLEKAIVTDCSRYIYGAPACIHLVIGGAAYCYYRVGIIRRIYGIRIIMISRYS